MKLLPLTETSGASNPKTKYHIQEGVNLMIWFDVFLTVHHSIDFSKYQLSAQLF